MKNIGCGFWMIFLFALFLFKVVIRIGIITILLGIGWIIFFGLIGVLLYVIFIRTFTCTKD
ncbi:MAG: hypothetical protein J6W00_12585 [Lentisphaeria bacterium]|nr:hypothetical protein [Lentisphaeria bacterium]